MSLTSCIANLIDNTTVIVSWTGTFSYVHIEKSFDDVVLNYTTIASCFPGNSTICSNLTFNTLYFFKVTPYSDNGIPGKPEIVFATTPYTSQIISCTTGSPTSTSIPLSWIGNYYKIDLTYGIQGASAYYALTKSLIGLPSYTIINLSSDTIYDLSLIPMDESGKIGTPFFFPSVKTSYIPSILNDLSCINITDIQCTLSWTGRFNQVMIQYSNDGITFSDVTLLTMDNNNTNQVMRTFLFNFLSRFTFYWVRAIPYDSYFNSGPISSSVKFQTLTGIQYLTILPAIKPHFSWAGIYSYAKLSWYPIGKQNDVSSCTFYHSTVNNYTVNDYIPDLCSNTLYTFSLIPYDPSNNPGQINQIPTVLTDYSANVVFTISNPTETSLTLTLSGNYPCFSTCWVQSCLSGSSGVASSSFIDVSLLTLPDLSVSASSPPSPYTFTVTGLNPNTDYIIKLTPLSTYNVSGQSVTMNGTTNGRLYTYSMYVDISNIIHLLWTGSADKYYYQCLSGTSPLNSHDMSRVSLQLINHVGSISSSSLQQQYSTGIKVPTQFENASGYTYYIILVPGNRDGTTYGAPFGPLYIPFVNKIDISNININNQNQNQFIIEWSGIYDGATVSGYSSSAMINYSSSKKSATITDPNQLVSTLNYFVIPTSYTYWPYSAAAVSDSSIIYGIASNPVYIPCITDISFTKISDQAVTFNWIGGKYDAVSVYGISGIQSITTVKIKSNYTFNTITDSSGYSSYYVIPTYAPSRPINTNSTITYGLRSRTLNVPIISSIIVKCPSDNSLRTWNMNVTVYGYYSTATIYYSGGGLVAGKFTGITASGQTVLISGLKSNTQYSFYGVPYDISNFPGVASPVQYLSTFSTLQDLGFSYNVLQSTSGNIVLDWVNSGYYSSLVIDQSTNGISSIGYDGLQAYTGRTRSTFSGLSPNTEYDMKVTAYDNNDNSEWSIVKAYTLATTNLLSMSCSGGQGNHDNYGDLTLNWKPSGYSTISISGQGYMTSPVQYQPPINQLNFTGLAANTAYTYEIGVKNSDTTAPDASSLHTKFVATTLGTISSFYAGNYSDFSTNITSGVNNMFYIRIPITLGTVSMYKWCSRILLSLSISGDNGVTNFCNTSIDASVLTAPDYTFFLDSNNNTILNQPNQIYLLNAAAINISGIVTGFSTTGLQLKSLPAITTFKWYGNTADSSSVVFVWDGSYDSLSLVLMNMNNGNTRTSIWESSGTQHNLITGLDPNTSYKFVATPLGKQPLIVPASVKKDFSGANTNMVMATTLAKFNTINYNNYNINPSSIPLVWDGSFTSVSIIYNASAAGQIIPTTTQSATFSNALYPSGTTIKGLSGNMDYTFQIYPMNLNNTSGSVTTLYGKTLAYLGQITSSVYNNNSVVLNLSADSLFSSWNASYFDISGNKKTTGLTSLYNAYAAINLKPCTDTFFTLSGYNNLNGYGFPTTATYNVRTAPVINFTVGSDISSSYCSLYPVGYYASYILTYTNKYAQQISVSADNGIAPYNPTQYVSVTLRDLSQNTDYSFNITAYNWTNLSGLSSYQYSSHITSQGLIPTFQIGIQTTNSVSLNMTAGSSYAAAHIRLYYGNGGTSVYDLSFIVTAADISNLNNVVDILQLTVNSQYYVTMAPINSSLHEGNESAQYLIATLGNITSFSGYNYSNITETTVPLTCSGHYGNVGFNISGIFNTFGLFNTLVNTTVPALVPPITTTTAISIGLDANTHYSYQVTPINIIGISGTPVGLNDGSIVTLGNITMAQNTSLGDSSATFIIDGSFTQVVIYARNQQTLQTTIFPKIYNHPGGPITTAAGDISGLAYDASYIFYIVPINSIQYQNPFYNPWNIHYNPLYGGGINAVVDSSYRIIIQTLPKITSFDTSTNDISSISISWDGSFSNYSHIIYGITPSATDSSINVIAPIRRTLVTNLSYNTTYYYSITPYSVSAGYTFPITISATTLPFLYSPSAVVSATGPNTVQCNWNGQYNTITLSGGIGSVAFSKTYITVPGGGSTVGTSSSDISNLLPNTLCTFSLKPYNNRGQIGTTVSCSTTTLPIFNASINNPNTIGDISAQLTLSGAYNTINVSLSGQTSFQSIYSGSSNGISNGSGNTGSDISGLIPNSTYKYSLTPYNSTPLFGATISGSFTTLPKVTGVAISHITTISSIPFIVNGWFNGLFVQASGGSTQSYSTLSNLFTSPTSLTSLSGNFTGLATNTLYNFRFTPIGQYNASGYLFTVADSSAYTLPAMNGTIIPQPIFIGDTSAQLTLSGAYYTVNVSGGNSSGNNNFIKTYSSPDISSNTSSDISGLIPNTTYTFFMTPYNVPKYAGGTISGSFTTLPKVGNASIVYPSPSTTLATVSSLYLTVSGWFNSLFIQASGGAIPTYGSLLSTTFTSSTPNTPVTSLSGTFNGLATNTLYNFRFIPTGQYGASGYLFTMPLDASAYTLPAMNGTMMPQPIYIGDISAQLSLSGAYYTVNVSGGSTGGNSNFLKTYPSPDISSNTSSDISGLTPNTSYTYFMTPYNVPKYAGVMISGSFITLPKVSSASVSHTLATTSATVSSLYLTVSGWFNSLYIQASGGAIPSYGSLLSTTFTSSAPTIPVTSLSGTFNGLATNTLYNFRFTPTGQYGASGYLYTMPLDASAYTLPAMSGTIMPQPIYIGDTSAQLSLSGAYNTVNVSGGNSSSGLSIFTRTYLSPDVSTNTSTDISGLIPNNSYTFYMTPYNVPKYAGAMISGSFITLPKVSNISVVHSSSTTSATVSSLY